MKWRWWKQWKLLVWKTKFCSSEKISKENKCNYIFICPTNCTWTMEYLYCLLNISYVTLANDQLDEQIFNTMLIKGPTWCNSMQTFIYCRVTLHVSGVTAPIIRRTKNCICYLWYKSCGIATSFHRGPIRPRWKEVAVPVPWLIPEVADTVFSIPDDGCYDTWNM